jgi:hypothetical protein
MQPASIVQVVYSSTITTVVHLALLYFQSPIFMVDARLVMIQVALTVPILNVSSAIIQKYFSVRLADQVVPIHTF